MRNTFSALSTAALTALLAAACATPSGEEETVYESTDKALAAKPALASIGRTSYQQAQPASQTAWYGADAPEPIYGVDTTTLRPSQIAHGLTGKVVGLAMSPQLGQHFVRMAEPGRIEVLDRAGQWIRTITAQGVRRACEGAPAQTAPTTGTRTPSVPARAPVAVAFPQSKCGLAIEWATGHLFLDDGPNIVEIDQAGVAVQTFTLPGGVTNVGGLGFHQTTGMLWVLDADAAELLEVDRRGAAQRSMHVPANVQLTVLDVESADNELTMVHDAGTEAVLHNPNTGATRFVSLQRRGGELGGAAAGW